MSKGLKKQIQEESEQLIQELLNDGDIPQDLIDSIREAEKHEFSERMGGSDITTGQPYRLSDVDDFPFGTYIQSQTGRIISRHFRMDDEYQIKQDVMLELLKDLGYQRIFDRSYYGDRSYSSALVYEKKIGDSITLIHISNVINKFLKKTKKSFIDSIGIDVHIAACEVGLERGWGDFSIASKVDAYMGTAKRTSRDKQIHSPVVACHVKELSKKVTDLELNTAIKGRLESYATYLSEKPLDIPAFQMRDVPIPFGADMTPIEAVCASHLIAHFSSGK